MLQWYTLILKYKTYTYYFIHTTGLLMWVGQKKMEGCYDFYGVELWNLNSTSIINIVTTSQIIIFWTI